MNEKIKNYCKELKEIYPRFFMYLHEQIDIADYFMEMYLKNVVSSELSYKTKFNELEQIELSKEIINSISSELLDRYNLELSKGNIIFNDNSKSFSYTNVENNEIKCHICKSDNISSSISAVHEFFHLLHLEKYSNNIADENYYFFTEIFGLVADFYSMFYLEFIKKEYVEDIKAYFSNFFGALTQISQMTLILGTIIDINETKGNINNDSINSYVTEKKLSKDFLEIEDFLDDYDINEYDEVSRYVFALPIAFIMSTELLTDSKSYLKYKNAFSDLENNNVEECMEEVGLLNHLKDKKYLQSLMDTMYINFEDLMQFEENNKVKKFKQ